MKKIISVILLLVTGISTIYANDSIVWIVKESKVEDVRKVGYELCRLFIDNKGYLHQMKDYIFGMEVEEEVAYNIKQYDEENPISVINLDNPDQSKPNVWSSIVSSKASEDKIMRALREGFFDYMSEKILSLAQGLNETLTSFHETLFSVWNIHCIDPSSNEIVKGDSGSHYFGVHFDTKNTSNLIYCIQEKLDSYKAWVKDEGPILYYLKMIDVLGIEQERVEALRNKYMNTFIRLHDNREQEL